MSKFAIATRTPLLCIFHNDFWFVLSLYFFNQVENVSGLDLAHDHAIRADPLDRAAADAVLAAFTAAAADASATASASASNDMGDKEAAAAKMGGDENHGIGVGGNNCGGGKSGGGSGSGSIGDDEKFVDDILASLHIMPRIGVSLAFLKVVIVTVIVVVGGDRGSGGGDNRW
jgi:hypothetical protein